MPNSDQPSKPPSQTHVIAAAIVQAAPSPGTGGTLRVAGDVPAAAGDILASGVSDAAPDGFLLKVTGRHVDGASTVFDVVPATLLEAIPEGHIDEQIQFAASPAASLNARRQLRQQVRSLVACSSGGTVTIDGDAGISPPALDIDIDWGFFHLDSVEVTASVTATASASATATGAASCSVGPIKIAEINLPPITFTVGAVPVVLTPEIEIDLSGLGEVEASVATSVDASLTATAGAKYEDGSLSPIADLSENFDFQPPDPQGSAKLEATLSTALEIEFYGAGGPEFTFNAGLEANANLNAPDPWWTLDAPISFTAGLDIDSLGVEAGPITVYEHKFRLAQAPSREPMYRITDGEARYETTYGGQCASPDLYPCGIFDGGYIAPSSTIAAGDNIRLTVRNSSDFRLAGNVLLSDSSIQAWEHQWDRITNYSHTPYGIPMQLRQEDKTLSYPEPGQDNAIELAVWAGPPSSGRPTTEPQVALSGENYGLGIRTSWSDSRPLAGLKERWIPAPPDCNPCEFPNVPVDLITTRRAFDPVDLILLNFGSFSRTPYKEQPTYGAPRCTGARCTTRVTGVDGYNDVHNSAYIVGAQQQRIHWWYDIETCFNACTD